MERRVRTRLGDGGLVEMTPSEIRAVDMGDEVVLSFDGSGNLDSGSRVDELYSYQSHRGDPIAMRDARRDLGLGRIPVQDLTYPNRPGAMEAKFRIAEVLEVLINSVARFTTHAGLGAGAGA